MINKTLKLGIPAKNEFHELTRVENSPTGHHPAVTGFPSNVFNEVMAMLPYQFQCEFIQYVGNGDTPGYYDSLISQAYFKAS